MRHWKMAIKDYRTRACGARSESTRLVGALGSPAGGWVRPLDYLVCVGARRGHIINFVGMATMFVQKVALG